MTTSAVDASEQVSLRLEDFFPLARSLARRIAWEPDDADDLFQEGVVALHLALRKNPRLRKPHAFARTVLSRAMRGHYPAARRSAPSLLSVEELLDGDGGRLPAALTAEPGEQVDLIGEFLADLEKRYGRQARWAAESLIVPGASFGAFVMVEVEEKRRRKRPGYDHRNPRGVENIRTSHRQVREALGLSASRWHGLLGEIRGFACEWLPAHDVALPVNQ